MKSVVDYGRKHYKGIMLLILFLIVSTGLFISAKKQIGGTGNFWIAFYWGIVFLLITTAVLFSHFSLKCKTIEKMFLLMVIPLSIIYLGIFTPGTVPDEPVHYFYAYHYSNNFLMNFDDFDKETGLLDVREEEKENLLNIQQNSLSIRNHKNIINHFTFFCKDSKTERMGISWNLAVSNAKFGYIFSALGITVGRVLQLGMVPTYYLARIFNLIFYIFACYYTIKIIPFGKAAIAVAATLPISMQEAISCSYDPVIIGCAFLFAAIVMKIIYEKQADLQMIIIACILMFVLAPSKIVYSVLVFLVLLVPVKKINQKHISLRIKAAIISSGAAGLFLMQLTRITGYASQTSSGTSYYSISWILNNIVDAIIIFINTSLQKATFYFDSLFGAFVGWFQFNVPIVSMIFFSLFIAGGLKHKDDHIIVKPSHKWLSFSIIALGFGFVLLSMMVSWTTVGSPVIEGVQGRYFIPFLPIVLILLHSQKIQTSAKLDNTILLLNIYTHVFTLMYLSYRIVLA